MLRATLRSLLARKLRLLLSGVAILLGVSFVAGSFILTDTMSKVFDNLFAKVNANVDVVVRGVENEVGSANKSTPAAVLPRVQNVPGVEFAIGNYFGYAQVVDKEGETYPYNPGPPPLGFNYDGGTPVSSIELTSGRGPTASDEVVIDATTAKNTHYLAGDTAPILTRLGRANYHIVGVFTSGGSANQGGASVTLFTQDEAARVLGRAGEFDNITVAATDGISAEELRARIATVLPKDVEAVTGTEDAADLADDVQEGLAFFQVFLLIFAGVALFVGAFIIFNTFSMLIAQRSRELAMMRALGANRGQITRAVLLEAVVVGFIATTIGLGLGVLVALAIRALIEWLLGGGLPSGALVFQTRTFVVTYLVGVVITTLAALIPARRASRVPPMAALREAMIPDASRSRGITAGAVSLVLGIVALGFGLQGNWLALAVGAIAVFLGVAALSPLVVPPVVRVVSAPFSRRVPGRLGRRNALRNPRRTATTAGALMIGVALVSAVSVLGASMKVSINDVIDRAFAADFSVQDKSFIGLTPAIGTALEDDPDVSQVDRLGFAEALVDGDDAFLTAAPNKAIGVTVQLAQRAGSLTLGPGVILVDETHAKDHDWQLGDQIDVQFERGLEHALTLGGIYEDNALVGAYLVDESERKYFEQRLDGVVLLTGAAGVPLGQVRATVDRVIKPYPNAEVLDREEFIDQQASFVDILLAIITALLVLSIIIAVIGIVNALALSIIERTRELGLLRAVGLSRKELRRMVRVESVVVAVFGGVLGLVVGSALGVALVKALESQGVESLAFPYGRLLLILVLAALAGVIAALWPARRAARLDILDAIATE